MIPGAAINHALKKRGVDVRQTAALLAVYLKQDLRSGKAQLRFGKGEYLTSNRALLTMIGIYLLLGLSVSLLAFVGADVFNYSVVALSLTLFIVALAVIAESGDILFSESELDIIGHLPVSPRTHFAAKTLNLFLFTSLLAAAVNVFPALAGVWANGSSGLFVVAHAVAVALVAVFAAALVVTSYSLLMRYVSKERFDNFVAYSQVALVLLFMLSYQLLPHIVDISQAQVASGPRWYYLLYPPAWFASVTMILMGRLNATTLLLAGLALISVVMLATLAFRKVAFAYSSFVSQLAFGQDKAKIKRNRARYFQAAGEGFARRARRESGLLRLVKTSLLRTPIERAVFDLVSIYLRRNREIKVRLYPSFAYFIFFPLLAIFTDGLPDPFTTSEIPITCLISSEIVCFVALTMIEGLLFCEDYHAAYIFRAAPINQLGEVHSGFRKAVLLYAVVPGFVILMLLYSLMWLDPLHALLVIAPWIALSPTMLVMPFVFREALPLSRKYQKGQQSARNALLFIFCLPGLSILLAVQMMALRGFFSYWIFILFVAAASPVAYLLARKISGEAGRISSTSI